LPADDLYIVASKCSPNHSISYKYKTVRQFKQHLLQNSPILLLFTSTSDC